MKLQLTITNVTTWTRFIFGELQRGVKYVFPLNIIFTVIIVFYIFQSNRKIEIYLKTNSNGFAKIIIQTKTHILVNKNLTVDQIICRELYDNKNNINNPQDTLANLKPNLGF